MIRYVGAPFHKSGMPNSHPVQASRVIIQTERAKGWRAVKAAEESYGFPKKKGLGIAALRPLRCKFFTKGYAGNYGSQPNSSERGLLKKTGRLIIGSAF